MSDVVIRVDNIGKKYRIGAPEVGFKTLRDTIAHGFKVPLKRLRSVAGGHSATVSPDTIWALKDVSFEVKQGEVLGIIGRNGAGKSTLLKILSRITEPTVGEIELRGRVGTLLEVGTGFHPELTGRENTYLNGAILGMKRDEIRQRFDEIVAFAETGKFIDTPVKYYSSGMYMRLAFSVAAHLESEILIVDEVLAVGDMAFQKKCLGKMSDVAAAGRTVLFVSHNMPAVLNLCTRVILLESGHITQMGDTETLVHQYLNTGLTVAAEQFFPDSRVLKYPDTDLCFTGIRILNKNYEPTSFVHLTEDFFVEVHYRILHSIRSAQVSIILWNQDGVCVLTSTDMDEDVSLIKRELKPGDCVSRIRIPGHLLRTGRYWIDLGSSIPGKRMLDIIEQSIAFEVIDNGSLDLKLSQRRRGIIGPILRWDSMT